MATFNRYTAIFRKLKQILNSDARTSQWAVYGGEYAKKKTFPCILLFPEGKEVINDGEVQRERKKYGSVKQVEYIFNIWVYIHLMELEDAYFSDTNDAKSGITQMLVEIEEVLKDNKTANDIFDSTIQLWSDIEFNDHRVSPKFAKLMNGMLTVRFLAKEVD